MSGSMNQIVLIFLVALVVLLSADNDLDSYVPPTRNRERLFPATFVFGDSLADNGNNNYFHTLARADQLPHGVDFPFGPTGRFSNGKTFIDVVSDRVGLPPAPPALAPTTKGRRLLHGVNYASAAAGILESTGFNWIKTIPLSGQIDLFQDTIKALRAQLGDAKAEKLISESLYVFVIGMNDYIDNYYVNSTTSDMYPDMNNYRNLLVNKFTYQLRRLYDLGARKVAVAGIGPLGCLPAMLAKYPEKKWMCFDSEPLNHEAQLFNSAMKKVTSMLNKLLKGSMFVFFDTYRVLRDILKDPISYNFDYDTTDRACCGAGSFNAVTYCRPLPNVTVCDDRESYIFWDGFHPTEAMNEYLGAMFSVDPMSLKQLSRL